MLFEEAEAEAPLIDVVTDTIDPSLGLGDVVLLSFHKVPPLGNDA